MTWFDHEFATSRPGRGSRRAPCKVAALVQQFQPMAVQFVLDHLVAAWSASDYEIGFSPE